MCVWCYLVQDIIIFSAVHTDSWRQLNNTELDETLRIALTRARERLIFVGNLKALEKSNYFSIAADGTTTTTVESKVSLPVKV